MHWRNKNMKHIVAGQIMHESSSLAKHPTEVENFRRTLIWFEKNDVFQLSEIGMRDYLTGIIEKGTELGMEIAPCFCTFASPSGVISASCFQTLMDRFFDGIDTDKPIDGFCLALHGAGVSQDEPDVEGAVLEEIRRRFGYEVPIVVTLDPHANITRKMIESKALLLPSKLYPHTDTYETGEKAAQLLKDLLDQKISPVMHVKKLPLLIPITKGCTDEAPMKTLLEKCSEKETIAGMIACTFVHGFPYSDIEECGASVVVITDGNQELAQETANDIGDYVMENRKDFLSDCLTVTQGVDLAEALLARSHGPIIMNEASDNPGAGTPGDGTFLLRELIRRDIPKTCCGAIIDPQTVALAVSAGVGARINIMLGGKTDALHGTPVALEDVYVKAITDGTYNIMSPMTHGQPVNFGRTVRLQKGNVDIVVASNAFQIMDDGIFLLLGIDVKEYNIVSVKSAQHFKAYFEKISGNIITVDPPGISTGNLETLPLQNIQRPIFPLDDI